MSLAQSFLKPEDPWSKRFSAPGECNLHPTQMEPQRILSWYGMRVTCEFGIGGATRVTLRAARKLCVENTCTCTARAPCTPAPFFIRRQVGLAKVHPCTEFGVASSKFTFTGGPHVKKVFRPWRVQPAALWNDNPTSTQVGVVHIGPASLRSAVPSV